MSRPNSDSVWVSKNGKETKIKDMSTRHLVNTVKLIERGDHGTVDKDSDMFHVLKAELAGRGKKNKRDKILQAMPADLVKTGFMSPRGKIDS